MSTIATAAKTKGKPKKAVAYTTVPVTRIAPLESLRGIAALGVAVFHLANTSVLVDNPIINNAPLLVDFFFVLSGFVISLSFTNRIRTPKSLLLFQWRRVRRLVPLHFFTLALWIGIVLCMPYVAGGYPDYSTPEQAGNFWGVMGGELFDHLTLIHGITPGGFLSFNYPSWTISVEFWTYLIFAVAVIFFRHIIWVGAAGAAIFCMFLLLNSDVHLNLITNSPLALARCVYGFSMGILAYRMVVWLKFKTTSLLPGVLIILALAGLALLGKTPYEVVMTGLFAGIVALCSRLQHDTVLYQLLNARWMVFLGTISYSIYMVHAALWWVIPQIASRIFGMEVIVGEYGHVHMSLNGQFENTAYTLFCIAVLIPIASLTYYVVERPFMSNPLRRKIRARRAAGGGVARRRPAGGVAPKGRRATAGGNRSMPDAAVSTTRNPAILARERMQAARRKVTVAEAQGEFAGSGIRGKGHGSKGVPNWAGDGYPDWQRGKPPKRR